MFLSFKGAWRDGGRLCAFKGSSVNLTCTSATPAGNLIWYTVTRNDAVFILEELPADENYVTHNTTEDNNATLTIIEVRERDGNIYCCRESDENPELCWNKGTELQVAGTAAAPRFFI